jgi:hypothetical protein
VSKAEWEWGKRSVSMKLRGLIRAGGLAAAVATAWPCAAGWLEISGDPLTIRADEYGTLGVLRRESGVPVPQYYATCAKGSALFLERGRTSNHWGSGTSTFALWDVAVTGQFTAVSHTQPDPWTLRTTFDAGSSGLQVIQTASYSNGAPFYALTWQVRNGGQTPAANLRFVHGGDVSLGGEDIAAGYWDAASNLVYVQSATPVVGMMGLQGLGGSPATHYMAGHFQLVRDAAKSGTLPDTADGSAHDAAYALAWHREALNPGETWTIAARELWSGVATQAPPQVGEVACTLSPTGAVAAGAHWRLTSGGETNWQLSGAVVTNVAPGARILTFSVAANWSTPSNLTVQVAAGGRVTTNAQYVALPLPPDTNTPADVTGALLHPLFTAWRLNRQTGTLFGALRLQNAGQTPLRGPVWLAIQLASERRFMHPTGTLGDGRGYLDLTAAFNTALGDRTLDPGDSITIPDIEVYTQNRAVPPDAVFSVWAAAAAPKGAGE